MGLDLLRDLPKTHVLGYLYASPLGLCSFRSE
jgi:hypothetical protein